MLTFPSSAENKKKMQEKQQQYAVCVSVESMMRI